MKKILSCAIAFTLITLCFAGCLEKKPENAVKEILPEPEPEEEKVIDYEDAYMPVISRYNKLVSEVINFEDVTTEAEDEIGVVEASKALEEKALDIIGYNIRDISGDGVPELLIGTSGNNNGAYTKNEVYAIYTIWGNKPCYVLSGHSRNFYSLMGNGNLYYRGSSSGASVACGEFCLSEDGSKAECKNFYFTYAEEENPANIKYYHNTTGSFEINASEEFTVSEWEFEETDKSMASKTIEINFTPLAEFASWYAVEAGKTAVSVDFADDEIRGEYKEFIADDTDMQVKVLFTSASKTEKFKLLGLSYKGVDAKGKIVFDEEVLYEQETLDKNSPLVVGMTFFGTIPSYGISYLDVDGRTKRFTVEMSGVDGNLYLSEMK